MSKKIFWMCLAVSFTVFFIDRWRKLPFANVEYFRNTGIGFSLPLPLPATIIVSTAIIFGFILWFYIVLKTRDWIRSSFLAPVLLGATSNLADRLIYRGTLDYIHISTGVFNLADVLIFLGIVGLIFFPFKPCARSV